MKVLQDKVINTAIRLRIYDWLRGMLTTVFPKYKHNRHQNENLLTEMRLSRPFDDTNTESGCVRKPRVSLVISVQITDSILHEIATGKRPRRDFLLFEQKLDAD